jgi:hypothetical protein
MFDLRMIARCLFLVPLLGCVSGRDKERPLAASTLAPSAISELNLLAIPVALDLDGVPGADGFVLKVYAGNRRRPKPIPIESGTLEIFMFEGILPSSGKEASKPRRTWTYTAEELKNSVVTTSIGIGYQIAPVWDTAKPAGDKITVVARYTPQGGAPILSAPSVISLTAQ